jgi:hypothetical protein
MLIRSLRAHITRLVLVGAMTATLAVGSVAIAPPHEAAAMPGSCAELLADTHSFMLAGTILMQHGYYELAVIYLDWADANFSVYKADCL